MGRAVLEPATPAPIPGCRIKNGATTERRPKIIGYHAVGTAVDTCTLYSLMRPALLGTRRAEIRPVWSSRRQRIQSDEGASSRPRQPANSKRSLPSRPIGRSPIPDSRANAPGRPRPVQEMHRSCAPKPSSAWAIAARKSGDGSQARGTQQYVDILVRTRPYPAHSAVAQNAWEPTRDAVLHKHFSDCRSLRCS
jgi:hypothetical protein